MSELPTILHVIAPAQFGGLERVVSDLARGLRARGRDVHVLAFLDSGTGEHPFVRGLTEAGVPAQSVEVPARRYGDERAALRRVIEETEAGLVHTHGARVDVVDSSVARRLGLATVSTLHGFTGGSGKNRFYEWLQVRAVRRCQGVVAVSRRMALRLLDAGVPADRLHVIQNAWCPRMQPLPRAEARAALGLPADGFRIGWVGRLTREKGADVLVRALALLGDVPISVSFVGAGRQQGMLRERARDGGRERGVTWHGVVPDAGRLMTAFDLFVLSSRTEGTPIVLFEAMAAEVPVVATTVGGVPDVVTPAEALLVPPDNPGALAEAIRMVLADPAAAHRRALAAASRLAEHFGADAWLDAYERVYAHVISGNHAGRSR